MALLMVLLAATLFTPVVLIVSPLLAMLLALFVGSSTHAQVNHKRPHRGDGHADAESALTSSEQA